MGSHRETSVGDIDSVRTHNGVLRAAWQSHMHMGGKSPRGNFIDRSGNKYLVPCLSLHLPTSYRRQHLYTANIAPMIEFGQNHSSNVPAHLYPVSTLYSR